MSVPLIDIHSHLQAAPATGIIRIGNLSVSTISTKKEPESAFSSIGAHPWHIPQLPENWQQTLQHIASKPPIIAIGEAGLDRAITTDFAHQLTIFQFHIALSEQLKKPLIIHCVRAYADLLYLRKESRAAQPWIVHGFQGSPQDAHQFTQKGCYLSFGAALLKNGSKAQKSFLSTPTAHLYLETDDQETVSIESLYQQAARLKQQTPAQINEQIWRNFRSCFPNLPLY